MIFLKNTGHKLKKIIIYSAITLTLGAFPVQGAESIHIEDLTGHSLELPEAASQIIALLPSDAEILYAIDAGDRLIGRGQYVDYPEMVLDLPALSTGPEMNLEEMIAMDPDLIIVDQGVNQGQLDQLEQANIPVFISAASTLEEVYETILLLGQATDHQDQAQNLIQEMKDEFTKYQDKAQKATQSQDHKLSIYYEVSPLEFGLWTAGRETFMDELGQMLNLENIFSDVQGWAEVSEEEVLERNPDLIATTMMASDQGPSPIEEILGRKGWQDISAVSDERIFMADNDVFTRPGPRLTEAIQALYDFVYND